MLYTANMVIVLTLTVVLTIGYALYYYLKRYTYCHRVISATPDGPISYQIEVEFFNEYENFIKSYHGRYVWRDATTGQRVSLEKEWLLDNLLDQYLFLKRKEKIANNA